MQSISVIKNQASEEKNLFRRLIDALGNILEENKTGKKNSIAVLDGVRALAILTVLFYHTAINAQIQNIKWLDRGTIAIIYTGYAGVTLFFVLSGFLLFLPYIKSLLFDSDWPSVRTFYLRRALRILPGYYISLFLCVVLLRWDFLRFDHLKNLLLFATFLMDSSKETFQQVNAPYWTLAVEWQFYMLLPWIALAMRPLVQRGSLLRRITVLTTCLVLIMVWGICSRYYGNYLVNNPDITFGLPSWPVHVAEALLYGCGGQGLHGKFLEDFAIGMFAAVCYTVARSRGVDSRLFRGLQRISPWLFIVSIGWLLLIPLSDAQIFTPFQATGLGDWYKSLFAGDWYLAFHELDLALGYGGLIIAVLFGGKMLKSVFEWTPLRWIGLISFSLYLWHNPIILAFVAANAPVLQNWGSFKVFLLYCGWMLIAAFPFALLYFVLIEKPFMKLSNALFKKEPKPVQRLDNVQAEQVVPVEVEVQAVQAPAPSVLAPPLSPASLT